MRNIFRKGKKNHQNSYKKIAENNDFSNITSIEEAKKLVKEDREIYHRDTFSNLYFPCNQNFKY